MLFTTDCIPYISVPVRKPNSISKSITIELDRFGVELFSVRSPLLRESLLFSFPPLTALRSACAIKAWHAA